MNKGSLEKDGKKIEFAYELYQPPIIPQPDAHGMSVPALKTSMAYYAKLAAGDIAGASQMTNDPPANSAMWLRYKERIGAESFKKNTQDYFSGAHEIRGRFVIGSEEMLLLYNQEDNALGIQLYRCGQGSCVMDEKHDSAEFDSMCRIFDALRDGTLRL